MLFLYSSLYAQQGQVDREPWIDTDRGGFRARRSRWSSQGHRRSPRQWVCRCHIWHRYLVLHSFYRAGAM